jgi:LAO/AO transport system kinase
VTDSINPGYVYEPTLIHDAGTLLTQVRQGNRVALAQAITLVESTAPTHQKLKSEFLHKCAALKNESVRIGITGVPGAGKSTLIENFGKFIIDKGHKLAVLAIDPSSTKTKGSILGDKTRMQHLSSNPGAFIRPTASGGNLGGTAHFTREVIMVCEVAGFDHILVETVGVGQSETLVNDLTDVFLLLAVPGTGDELQGIKRGIMEMANVIAINKTDGDNVIKAKQAASQLKNALHLYPVAHGDWTTKVLTISALENKGIDALVETLNSFIQYSKTSGNFQNKRNEQEQIWLDNYLLDLMKFELLGNINDSKLDELKKSVLKNNPSVYEAAVELLKKLKEKKL